MIRRVRQLLFTVAVTITVCPPVAAASAFEGHVRFLTQFEHRLAGSEVDQRVRDYIVGVLRGLGFDDTSLIIQPVEVVRPANGPGDCSLEARGSRFRLYPLRPNLVQAAVAEPEGISGSTVYCRKGRGDSLPEELDGRVVLLDFDCGEQWKRAFERGAKAVVFVGVVDRLEAYEPKFYEAAADLPRFYLQPEDAKAAGLFGGPVDVCIRSKASWDRLLTANIVAMIHPTEDSEGDDSAVIVGCEYDSYGDVPELAPNYRKALNTAAMLDLAETLKNTPSARKVLLCFFGDGAGNHNGGRRFYYSIIQKRERKSGFKSVLDAKIKYLTDEKTRLAEMSLFLREEGERLELTAPVGEARAGILSDDFEHHAELRKLLKAELGYRVADIREDAIFLSQDIRRGVYAEELVPEKKEELARLNETIRSWNNLNRDIKNRELTEKCSGHYAYVRDKALSVMRDRLLELDYYLEHLQAGERIGAYLLNEDEETTIISHISLNLSEQGDRWGLTIAGMLGPYKTILKGVQAATRTAEAAWPVAAGQGFGFDRLTPETRIPIGQSLPGGGHSVTVTALEGGGGGSGGITVSASNRAGGEGNELAIADAAVTFALAEGWPGLRLSLARGRGTISIAVNGETRETDDPGSLDGDSVGGTTLSTDVAADGGGGLLFVRGQVTELVVGGEQVWIDSLHPWDPLPMLQRATFEGAIKPTAFFPVQPSLCTDMSVSVGAFAFSFSTLNTIDPLYGTPFERLDRASMPRFARQLEEVRALLTELVREENFSAQQPTPDNKRIMDVTLTVTGDYSGPLVRLQQFGTALADYPCRGAVAALDTYSLSLLVPSVHHPEVNSAILVRSDQLGHLAYGPLRRWRTRKTIMRPGPNGGVLGMNDISQATGDSHVVFQGNGGHIFNVFNFHNQNFKSHFAPSHVKLMKSVGNVAFRRYHTSLTRDVLSFYVWGKETTQLYHVNSFMLLNLSEEGLAESRYGDGFAIKDRSWAAVDVEERSARDLHLLNESRLKVLRRKNIVNESLEVLHGKTAELLKGGKRLAAMVCEWRVYSPLKGSIDDIVKAAVILLLMIVPFAFVLERLLVGATIVYKQIAGFSVFFALTFAVLYAVHPAFDIAGTPIIIFLAFVIIIASGYVIFVIMQRFKGEIMRIQGLETSLHQADVSRFNTLIAAVSLGISTMRRRPLRTILTSVTIILLTFTILCFSSFNTEIGVIMSYKGQLCSDRSILVHTKDWSVLHKRNLQLIESLGEGKMKVFGRYWLSSSLADVVYNREPLKVIVSDADMHQHTALDAVMGLDPDEIPLKRRLGECFDGDLELLRSNGVFLAPMTIEKLGLQRGDTVYVRGRRCVLAGAVNVDKMAGMVHLDGSPFMPVDYSSIKNIMTSQDDIGTVIESMDSTQFTSVPPEMVALASNRMVALMDGNLRSVVAYPTETVDLQPLAEDVALVFGDFVYVGLKDGVYAAYFTDELSFSGLGDIVAPLLLGGLIIFTTMLASVVDREREIYAFSALGLAPPHVASLFFAEAAVYAIIGGLGGYLFSQVVVKFLALISRYGWVRVPELNPSSLTAIVTILIVMAVTMISTIYPAMKASKSANPGIQRAWRMPAAEGDLLDVTFPFTVSEYDLTGIVSFLKEHFVNFGDSTLGTFSSKEAQVFQDEAQQAPALRSNIWLAPFDLGISQKFTLTSAPSGIEGIAEVRIHIERLSGSPGSWYRSNKVFLEDLRRQFLIWRTVSHDHAEMYRNRSLEELAAGGGSPETDGADDEPSEV